MFSLESERERGKKGKELHVCEEDSDRMSEAHSCLEVYKAPIDSELMANGWSEFFRSL